jgi:hypothetical protein
MNAQAIISRLERFAETLPAAVAGLSPDGASFKPTTGAWSILEIVCHLADEEVDDFRSRLRGVLDDPSKPLAPIDPEGWARERRYNEQDLVATVARFVRERRESIGWLRSMKDPDWTRSHEHPRFGPIAAGDLLASWAAHDALHLRQIAKRLYELASLDAPEYKTAYAGQWGA